MQNLLMDIIAKFGWPAIVASSMLAVKVFVLEGYMRRGKEQKAPLRGELDRRSRTLNGVAFAAALLSPSMTYFGIGKLLFGTAIVAWCGLFTFCFGIAIRQWSIVTLGMFYTRALMIASNHRLVRGGPYKVVRHPGYLGNIMTWTGFGFTFSWIGGVIILLAMSAAYVYRIRAEESMLLEAFGKQYQQYMMTTKKLIPYIY